MKKILLSLFALSLTPSLLFAWEIKILSPADQATVPLLSPAQKAYLALPRAERIAFFADQDCRKMMVQAKHWPRPVRFTFESDAPEGTKFTLLLAEDPSFAHAERLEIKKANEIKADNFKIGQRYYWKVEGRAADGSTAVSKENTFTTEDQAPRLLRFADVPNVRDLGGRKTLEGRRVKQGLVFRTAGMNSNAGREKIKDVTILLAKRPELKYIAEALKEVQNEPEKAGLVTAPVKPDWTLFVIPGKTKLTAGEEKELMALTAIPAQFQNAGAETVKMDKRGYLRFDKRTEKRPAMAVMMQELESPSDGWLSVTCGGDWFWALYINGNLVCDRISGNDKPVSARNWPLIVPVKKGRNLLAVTLVNGSNGWRFGIRPHALKDADAVKKLADENQKSLISLPFGKMIAGKNRVKPEGRALFLGKYGVKSDIDLRSDNECWGMTGSPLGKEVTWFHISSASYGGMATPFGREAFTQVFKVFLDEKNYPIIFHCIAGQDRTGAVAFIISALLGVPEEQLYLDWETTGFWNPNEKFNHERLFNKLVKVFEAYPGKTINEKVEAYVLSLGFTQADIGKLRTIMLEK